MKNRLFFIFVLIGLFSFSQNIPKSSISKEFVVKNKIVLIDSVSISPYRFKLFLNDEIINTANYTIDFAKSRIAFINDSFNGKKIKVQYKPLPLFLTKTYKEFDESLIVDNSKSKHRKFYQLETTDRKEKTTAIFDGLETTGFLSRGITMGNNQDGVVNSGFKLQLKGKLSRKVGINATISDNTIPLQDNGYTQRLDEYDRIFVELFSDSWKLTAGDLFLNNNNSNYLNFNKRVKGLGVDVKFKGKKSTSNIYASGAIVEGEYKMVQFNGKEANQGPYRLANTANQFLLIIANSETVYVNGLPIDKKNYSIDYSAAEIMFNTTYPVNSDMRIVVEFQASEQNFTRYVSFNKANYQHKQFNLELDFYSESDSKSKSLQQDLSDTQKEILSNAGDDINQMYTLSAVSENFIEDKIQYRKILISGEEVFEYSNNPNDELYSVKFTYVGENQGNYSIENTIATGRIYTFVNEIGGIKQGDFEPKIQLNAPNKLQITSLKADFNNSKTRINTELAFSNNDANLFSAIDDANNTGFAGLLKWNQLLIDKEWKLNSDLSYEIIDKNYTSIERLKKIDFDRDWNINNILESNLSLLQTSLNYSNDENGLIQYQLENLTFLNYFKGIKHSLHSDLKFDKTKLYLSTSVMNSDSEIEKSNFNQFNADLTHYFSNFLVGVKLNNESNIRKNNDTEQLNNLSFKNKRYGTYFRIKDSLRTKIELGYEYITNDSLKNTALKRVNKSNNYYLKSDIIQKKTADLSIYFNYRQFSNLFFNNDKSLNSKISYRQQLVDNFFQFKTIYETSSGTIPQQEFNYLEVDPAKGYYTWIDYNNDGIQDLDEFEIAQFQDEAIYVRVLLPSTKFTRTNQTKLSNLVTINPSKWTNSTNVFKKYAAHFVNITNINIDNKQLKSSNFQLNPFVTNDALALQFNFKNHLFFNRGKQHYSITYSYLKSDNKTVYITGLQENNIESNQLQFSHKIDKKWLLDLQGVHTSTLSNNERFVSRNMNLLTNTALVKLSYLFNDSKSSLSMNYEFNDKQNNSINKEHLKAGDFGFSFQYLSNKKFSMNGSINYIDNVYSENQFSTISYQLLEGLQSGKNYTWSLILQKTLTNYLDLNLNYNARKSEKVNVIHTGNVQLRAKF